MVSWRGTGLIQDDEDLPEVKVEVYKGKREVVIKVSDKGTSEFFQEESLSIALLSQGEKAGTPYRTTYCFTDCICECRELLMGVAVSDKI